MFLNQNAKLLAKISCFDILSDANYFTLNYFTILSDVNHFRFFFFCF